MGLVAGTLAGVSCAIINEYPPLPYPSAGGGAGGGGGAPSQCTNDWECTATPCTEPVCDEGLCTDPPVDDGQGCDIGQGTGTCAEGVCVIECDAENFQTVCDDLEDCTDDTCDFTTGTCVNAPIAYQSHPTIGEVEGDCRINLCAGGLPVLDQPDDTDLPDDNNDCTTDICTDGTPDNVPLSHGTPCGSNGALFCNNSGVCVGCNNPFDCDGSDTTCQWRTCINEQCGVDNATAGTSCDDGVYCNGNDNCDGSGSCSVHLGDPCDGPDGDTDCSERCSENTDDCSRKDPDGSVCNDGTYCNGLDACQNGTCSQHASNPCPGHDLGPNCDDSCNEANADCTANDANGTACPSGQCYGGDCLP